VPLTAAVQHEGEPLAQPGDGSGLRLVAARVVATYRAERPVGPASWWPSGTWPGTRTTARTAGPPRCCSPAATSTASSAAPGTRGRAAGCNPLRQAVYSRTVRFSFRARQGSAAVVRGARQGGAHVVRGDRHWLDRRTAVRRRGGRPAPLGALLRAPGPPRPRQAPRRPAPRRRRGGRGPQRLRQLLPPGGAGPLPAPARPRGPLAAPGDDRRAQGHQAARA